MPTLLVKNAHTLVTMDDTRQEISGGGLFIRDGFIEQVGPTASLPESADEIVDLSGYVILPGLVNTHHHFYQTLTRAVPAAQDANLFGWLTTLYPIVYSAVLSTFNWSWGLTRDFVGLQNYTKLLGDSQFWRVIANTFYFALGAVAVEMLIGLVLALALTGLGCDRPSAFSRMTFRTSSSLKPTSSRT